MGATADRRGHWAAPTRADLVLAAGAAVVLALLATTVLVVEPGAGPVSRGIALQPDAAGAETPPEPPAPPPPHDGSFEHVAPPVEPPTYTRIAGVARVSASAQAGDRTRLQPACDYAWAPRVRMDDGTPAVVSVPGVVSGLVVANDRATWHCDYSYRAAVRTDSSAYPAQVQVPGGTGARPFGPYGF
jgi:hypothetical protein